MKDIMLLLSIALIISLFSAISSMAQTQYTSLEVINGQPTGYTNVITLNWLTPDTVQVTKTRRISTGGDKAATFDIAGLQYTATEHEVVFYIKDNTWLIPFEPNEFPKQITSYQDKCGCTCTSGVGCIVQIDYNPSTGTTTVSCLDDGCATHGNCTPWIEEAGNIGNGLFLRAKAVISQ